MNCVGVPAAVSKRARSSGSTCPQLSVATSTREPVLQRDCCEASVSVSCACEVHSRVTCVAPSCCDPLKGSSSSTSSPCASVKASRALPAPWTRVTTTVLPPQSVTASVSVPTCVASMRLVTVNCVTASAAVAVPSITQVSGSRASPAGSAGAMEQCV